MDTKTPAQFFKLYKGKVLVKFWPDSHTYYVNEDRKIGVTTFLGILDKSRALVIWATELAREFLIEKLEVGEKITKALIVEAAALHELRKKEAADVGTQIHDWAERYIRHILKEKGYEEMPEMPADPAVQMGAVAFLTWAKEHKVKFLSSERVVYSKKHDFVGKMDIEAKIDGKLCLVDIKSSNGLYNTVRLQTAAYVMADEEESGRKYKGRWAIRLAKETEEEFVVRMAKKNDNRKLRGKDPVDYGGYAVFEAKFLDDKKTDMARDKAAFLATKALFGWNKETDFFTYGK